MQIFSTLIEFYIYILIGRLILDYVLMFSRGFQPRGIMAVLFEFVFALTDPPLKFLRRFIPSLRIGNVSLDMSFIILILALNLLASILSI
ncbi:MAG: YggT family protein [Actinobacteria bacterium]|nr:YggT family protein [Actinomycetota bacterium]